MGTFISFVKETWPPAPKWTATDVPDLRGKVVLVTGGNSGIGARFTSLHLPLLTFPNRQNLPPGKETARVLLEHNAKVYIGCRSPDRARAAADELKGLTGRTDADLVVLRMDLGDLASVKGAVEEFLSWVAALY